MEHSKTYPFETSPPMLIIFGGLPATGKTTIARDLARQLGATYLRIDTIEHAIAPTKSEPINDEVDARAEKHTEIRAHKGGNGILKSAAAGSCR